MISIKKGFIVMSILLLAGGIFMANAYAEGYYNSQTKSYNYHGLANAYTAVNNVQSTPWTYGSNVHCDAESLSWNYPGPGPQGYPYAINNIGVSMHLYAEQYPFNPGHIVELHSESVGHQSSANAKIILDWGDLARHLYTLIRITRMMDQVYHGVQISLRPTTNIGKIIPF